MKFLEKNLEQIIFESYDKLNERGLSVDGKLYRQLKIGNYGIADLVTLKKPHYFKGYKTHYCGMITVYELKQDKIGVSAFLQALRYLNGIKSYLRKRNLDTKFSYKIVLIGSEIENDTNFVYLSNFIEDYEQGFENFYEKHFYLELITYSYDFDGINFNTETGYHLKNEGF